MAGDLALANGRREDRDEVLHRTAARTAAGAEVPIVIVNVSPSGLMARCDVALAIGDTLGVRIPGAPVASATVRWALGGRIGCEFATAIPAARYFAMLARLR